MPYSIKKSTINNQTRFDEKSSGSNNDQRDKHRGHSFIGRDDQNDMKCLTFYYRISSISKREFPYTALTPVTKTSPTLWCESCKDSDSACFLQIKD